MVLDDHVILLCLCIKVAISKQLEKTCAGFCSLSSFCRKAVETFVPGMIKNIPASMVSLLIGSFINCIVSRNIHLDNH